MPTQREIADHLFLAQQNVSEMLRKLSIDWRLATMDEIRRAYIDQLRAQAAGHRSESGDDLVRERVLSERVNREIQLLTLEEKRGTLVNVEQLRPMYSQMITAFRVELLSLPDKLKGELDALYGIEVDPELINGPIRNALEQLSRHQTGDTGVPAEPGLDAEASRAADDDGMGDPAPGAIPEGDGQAGPL